MSYQNTRLIDKKEKKTEIKSCIEKPERIFLEGTVVIKHVQHQSIMGNKWLLVIFMLTLVFFFIVRSVQLVFTHQQETIPTRIHPAIQTGSLFSKGGGTYFIK